MYGRQGRIRAGAPHSRRSRTDVRGTAGGTGGLRIRGRQRSAGHRDVRARLGPGERPGRDQHVPIALGLAERGVDRQAMLSDEMREDGLAVADDLAIVVDVGELTARSMRGVDDVLVTERNASEPQERIHLEAVAVVVGHAEQPGVRVERQHRVVLVRACVGTSASRDPSSRSKTLSESRDRR
jgi:hypothetical protein